MNFLKMIAVFSAPEWFITTDKKCFSFTLKYKISASYYVSYSNTHVLTGLCPTISFWMLQCTSVTKLIKWHIKCLEVALYQYPDSRTKKLFTENSYLSLCVHLCRLRTFRVIKRKEKKQIIFLYISVVVVLFYIRHQDLLQEDVGFKKNLKRRK